MRTTKPWCRRWGWGAVGLALLAGACEDPEKHHKADEAALWVAKWASQTQFEHGWALDGVTVPDVGKVVMAVKVPGADDVHAIKARRRMEQSYIARLACPPAEAEVFAILDPDQDLWVDLLEPDGTLITATTCKRE